MRTHRLAGYLLAPAVLAAAVLLTRLTARMVEVLTGGLVEAVTR